jgi:hydrogenase maturation protease
MNKSPARCLILACGNTLRGDDGVGPWLADWAEKQFKADGRVCVLIRQQWTPELTEEIAHTESVLFIDCSAESAPGSVRILNVQPSAATQALATHHLGAPELLALGCELYDSLPLNALLLTVGAGSMELGEEFSHPVKAALPEACRLLAETVLRLLDGQELQA